MRPFGKLNSDCTDTIVVVDQIRSMIRRGHGMAKNAVFSGRHQGTVDTADAAGGVAIGAAVGDKATFGRLKERSKVAAGRELGWCKSGCGMACDAPVGG
jgi:hypothetical protein